MTTATASSVPVDVARSRQASRTSSPVATAAGVRWWPPVRTRRPVVIRAAASRPSRVTQKVACAGGRVTARWASQGSRTRPEPISSREVKVTCSTL